MRVPFIVMLAGLIVSPVSGQSALEDGIALYWSGQYQETIATLGPFRAAELRHDEKVECLKYLAFSQVAVGGEDEARGVFVELLQADPATELDASQLSPKILRQFERAREQLVQELFEQGKQSYASKDYQGCLETMARTLVLDPDFVLANEYKDLAVQQLSLLEQAAALEASAAPAAAPDDGDRVYHLTSEIQPPALVTQVNPEYPISARRQRREGSVVIAAVVGVDGSVRAAKIVRSVSADVDEAALDAVRQWRYRPAIRGDRVVAVHTVIQVAFKLDD